MWLKLIELSVPVALGSILTLVATTMTARSAREFQSTEAATQRAANLQEARRAEAIVQTRALLERLTALHNQRRRLAAMSWVEEKTINTSQIEAAIRIIPDAPTRHALTGLRYPLTLGTAEIGFLPSEYDSPWRTEREALVDALETVATYIRGDELDPALVSRQLKRNEDCKKAQAEVWAELEANGEI